MDSDHKLFAIGWSMFTIVVCTIVLTIGSCTYGKNQLITDAIKSGADPLKVSCAYDSMISTQCTLLVSKQIEQK